LTTAPSRCYIRRQGLGHGSVIGKGWEDRLMEGSFPKCMKCHDGVLIPITYKAWVCSNPECGFNLRIDNGEISVGRTIGQSLK
jgi:hypothetical protein